VQNTVEDIDNQWSRIKQIITDSASVAIGYPPKHERKRWFDNICREAIRKRNELRKHMLQTPSKENKIDYENWGKETHKI